MAEELHQVLIDEDELVLIRYFAGKLLAASVEDADKWSWASEIVFIADNVLDGK